MEEQDRHRKQMYLYPSINKRSQVNHTFVLKLEHSTQHVLKKARKFPQTGTAVPGAGSAHPLPGAHWGSRHRRPAAGKEPNAVRLLRARSLTPSLAMGWWPLPLRSQRVPAPPSETCRRRLPLPRNKKSSGFDSGSFFASLVVGRTQARSLHLCCKEKS